MTNPITPPPELVQQWRKEREYFDGNKLVTMVTMTTDRLMQLCKKSAQHGADQELEACAEWVGRMFHGHKTWSDELRAARRPKPPTLKRQAIAELEKVHMLWDTTEFSQDTLDSLDTIRRALEALDD